MCRILPEALQHLQIVQGYTDADIARLAECHADTIAAARRDERDVYASKYLRASQRLMERDGVLTLGNLALAPGYVIVKATDGTADGHAEDNVVRGSAALTDFYRAHGSQDVEGMDAAIALYEAELHHLKAERDRTARARRYAGFE